jgi:hypothetical protein
MSVLDFGSHVGSSRAFRGTRAKAHRSDKKRFTPGLALARLFLSALAGLLAIHFWRSGRR